MESDFMAKSSGRAMFPSLPGVPRLDPERARGFPAGDICLHRVDRAPVEVGVKKGRGDGDAGKSQRIARVDLDGPLEHLDCVLETLTPMLVIERAAAQIVVV